MSDLFPFGILGIYGFIVIFSVVFIIIWIIKRIFFDKEDFEKRDF